MKPPSQSVGLGGDGDEIAAIGEVEKAFGVTLDYGSAHEWRTAGDVYAALLRELPAGAADQPDTWRRFAIAICEETGTFPSSIGPESALLAEPGIWVHVANASALFWSVIAIVAIVGLGWLLIRGG